MNLLEKNLYRASRSSSGRALIRQCHCICQEAYPGLALRWARIYGRRWAFVCGEGQAPAYNSIKVELNQDLGICVDNPGVVSLTELEKLINLLREVFAGEPVRRL